MDAEGVEVPSVREEWEEENAKLQRPYRILAQEQVDPRVNDLVRWMGGLDHAFSVVQKVPLSSDKIDSLGADLESWDHLFLDKRQVWRP